MRLDSLKVIWTQMDFDLVKQREMLMVKLMQKVTDLVRLMDLSMGLRLVKY